METYVKIFSWSFYHPSFAMLLMRRTPHKNNSESLQDKIVHFVGIGGIGTSALAKYYLSKGTAVSGSDLAPSEITEELEQLGAAVHIGTHNADHVPDNAETVIYTAAVPKTNPELKEAKKRRLAVKSYAEAMGELTKQYETITVSGAHGKSTTTALCALALEEGYFDPMVIVGTKIKEFGNSNFRSGLGPYFVLEADEWNKSFLHYQPKIAVVTNIDAEHLDTYKTIEKVAETFEKYLAKVPADGRMIVNGDSVRLRAIGEKFGKQALFYSLQDREANLVRPILRIPGEHNVSNALAAFALGRYLGMYEPDILRGLARFGGAWRRFEWWGIVNGAYIIADYGHHPEEIKATIAAARGRFPLRRIWCVYQPHQYQRLAYLWEGFVNAFDGADHVGLLPVYDVAGRETKTAKAAVNSAKLAQTLQKRGKEVKYLESFDAAQSHIMKEARSGDIILMMGAGDIYELTRQLVMPIS